MDIVRALYDNYTSKRNNLTYSRDQVIENIQCFGNKHILLNLKTLTLSELNNNISDGTINISIGNQDIKISFNDSNFTKEEIINYINDKCIVNGEALLQFSLEVQRNANSYQGKYILTSQNESEMKFSGNREILFVLGLITFGDIQENKTTDKFQNIIINSGRYFFINLLSHISYIR